MTFVTIKEFPSYEISEDGTIRNIAKGNILSPWERTDGYVGITLYKDGVAHTRKIHRLVAEHFLADSYKDGLEVCHWDGDRFHNHKSNLRWDTHLENEQDKVRHRREGKSPVRTKRSVQTRPTKLTADIVVIIKGRLASGDNSFEIAESFGLSPGYVRNIASGKRWKNVSLQIAA